MTFLLSIFLSFCAIGFEPKQHIEHFPWKDALTPVKIITFEGEPKRVEKFYEDRKLNLSIRRVEVGDRHFVTHDSLLQKDECPVVPYKQAHSDLENNIGNLKLNAHGDYFLFQPNHRIHKSCLEKWGRVNFVASYQSAVGADMSCLDELGKRPVTIKNHAGVIANNLRALWQKKPVSIQCNEVMNWTGTAGHASTGPEDKMKTLPGISFPYISISSNDPKVKGNPTEDEKRELGFTIFHEGIHNLGYKHGAGVEYTYACESCCKKTTNKKAKVASCNICIGDYASGAGDKKYLADMLAWGASFDVSLRGDLPMKTAVNYMNETNDRKFGMIALARSTSDIFSPVGLELMQEVKVKIPDSDLTPEERSMIKDSDKDRDLFGILVKFRPEAKVIAHSYVNYYMDQNATTAINNIVANKGMLTKFMARPESGNDTYIASAIKDSLKNVLAGIFLKDYPKRSPDSTRASNLLTEMKLW